MDDRTSSSGRSGRGEQTDGWREAKQRRSRDRSLMTDGGLRISEIMNTLANRRLRYVLYLLREGEHTNVDEIAKQIAARERETSPTAVDERDYERVRIDLHHVQLPKLEDTGIVTYDRRTRSLDYDRLPAPIGEVLDYCATVEWPDTAEC